MLSDLPVQQPTCRACTFTYTYTQNDPGVTGRSRRFASELVLSNAGCLIAGFWTTANGVASKTKAKMDERR